MRNRKSHVDRQLEPLGHPPPILTNSVGTSSRAAGLKRNNAVRLLAMTFVFHSHSAPRRGVHGEEPLPMSYEMAAVGGALGSLT